MSSIEEALALGNDSSAAKLTLQYEGQVLNRGEQIAKSVPIAAPSLLLSSLTKKTPYIVICVDLDAPFVSAPFLSPIVHWIQSGLEQDSDGLLQTDVTSIVDWLPPSPPPISGPHRYLFVVFEQPVDFDLLRWDGTFPKPVRTWNRIRWNIDRFVKEAALQNMVAATWFDSV